MHCLEDRLRRRQFSGNLRHLKTEKPLIDFSSNDYLGLASTSSLLDNWILGQPSGPFGATGSRLLTGNSQCIEELEAKIAAFHGFDASLLFGSGYMANVGLISAVGQFKDALFFDSEVHASIRDGIRLSRADGHPFRHNDLAHLENKLRQVEVKGSRFICIESIYSTDGSTAPLVEICQLAKKYDAHVIVDEAHAVGILGPLGRGLAAQNNVTKEIFALVGTFGKAFGSYGAVVLGCNLLKQTLINFATSVIYSTALPFSNLSAIQSAYDRMPTLENERRHVTKLIQLFRQGQSHASNTHIQSIEVKGNQQVRKESERLAKLGFDVRPLMSPTVRRGHERLRITLHAFNTEEQLRVLLEAID